ncbi:MAG: sigma-70 family RNA polymerase sigma factor [Candidatus Brocadiae bacterium]|nr:sigma-70 family RNA polymerase sigma factor [Candidatus Brocadiia bacterium]
MDVRQEPDDASLVSLARNGDAKAFEALVHRHSGLVGGIAWQVLGDSNAAADVAQETFLKVHRRLETLEDPTRFRAWICGIARTSAIDWIRRNARQKSLEQLEDSGRETAAPAPKEGSLEQEELYAKVIRVVNGLPKLYRDVVVMKHLERKSYAEIAKAFGISVATVESRLYRARLLLRDTLAEFYE